MTKWLASVQSLNEAKQLSDVLPDILDIKNPSQGALGGLPLDQVSEIVRFIDERTQTSATIGDLPMDPQQVIPALQAMASTKVDYVKIGLFPSPSMTAFLSSINTAVSELTRPAIAVVFADKMKFEPALLRAIKNAGFKGVMVDTAIKDGRHLREHWSIAQLNQFVETAQELDLMTGLAGALRYQDIEALRPLAADYLGFRSALCPSQQRTQKLQTSLAKRIQQAMTVDAQKLKKAI